MSTERKQPKIAACDGEFFIDVKDCTIHPLVYLSDGITIYHFDDGDTTSYMKIDDIIHHYEHETFFYKNKKASEFFEAFSNLRTKLNKQKPNQ